MTNLQSYGRSQPGLRLPGRKPTHRLYCVKGDGAAANWTPIGAAWPHKDGCGFSLSCDALPLQGRLVLRFITDREPAGADAGGGHDAPSTYLLPEHVSEEQPMAYDSNEATR